jgi:hypothetical protein
MNKTLFLLPLCFSLNSVVAQLTDLPKRTENKVFRDRVKAQLAAGWQNVLVSGANGAGES